MSTDIFDELSALDVPPPPATIVHAVHERVNHSLLVWHGGDFALRAMPLAALHLFAAIAGGLVLTFTGKFPAPRSERPADSAE